MLYRRQLDLFQFLGDVWPLVQEASSVLTNWRGGGRLLNFVWEFPYRAVKDTREVCVVMATCGSLVVAKMPFYKPKDYHIQTLKIPLFVKILKSILLSGSFPPLGWIFDYHITATVTLHFRWQDAKLVNINKWELKNWPPVCKNKDPWMMKSSYSRDGERWFIDSDIENQKQ